MSSRARWVLLPLLSAGVVWACSDDAAAPTTDGAPDGGGDAPTTTTDAGDAAEPRRDCTNDLNGNEVWTHLECSGLYVSFSSKSLASDVKEYKPGVELWSDGAVKRRFIRLPAGTTIDVSEWDEWRFPEGTTLWKEFVLGGKRIETRMFKKGANSAWSHTTYRWNNDETDAVASSTGESIPGLGPDGGTYEIPEKGECETCHFGKKDQVLGFDAVSLGLPTATGYTLATLTSEGRLSPAPPKTSLDFPGNDGARAALGILNINCGVCHNPNTNAAASFASSLRLGVRAEQLAPSDGGVPATVEELDVWTTGYCKDANRDEDDAGVKFKFIRGAAPERSLVSVLSGRRVPEGEKPSSTVQMPPIVSRAVDHAGHRVLDDWIASLPACP